MKLSHIASSVLGILTLTGVGAQSALALPLGAETDAAARQAMPMSQQLAGSGVDFTAVVALDDCSGSLVRFRSSRPEDKAMVLTNGHCYEGGFLQPGQVVMNQSSDRTFNLLNADSSASLGTLTASRVLYATMTDTDITLYELAMTYADIESTYSVQALTISDKHPAAADPIRIVSGYWKKIYSCNIDNFVFELKEADWTWKDSIRYTSSGCEVVGGTSGSPILHADTREVIGINNTGNDNGERCTLDNPCEVAADGTVTVKQGTKYGEELYNLYGCLADDRSIDPTKAGCKLPKPASN